MSPQGAKGWDLTVSRKRYVAFVNHVVTLNPIWGNCGMRMKQIISKKKRFSDPWEAQKTALEEHYLHHRHKYLRCSVQFTLVPVTSTPLRVWLSNFGRLVEMAGNEQSQLPDRNVVEVTGQTPGPDDRQIAKGLCWRLHLKEWLTNIHISAGLR